MSFDAREYDELFDKVKTHEDARALFMRHVSGELPKHECVTIPFAWLLGQSRESRDSTYNDEEEKDCRVFTPHYFKRDMTFKLAVLPYDQRQDDNEYGDKAFVDRQNLMIACRNAIRLRLSEVQDAKCWYDHPYTVALLGTVLNKIETVDKEETLHVTLSYSIVDPEKKNVAAFPQDMTLVTPKATRAMIPAYTVPNSDEADAMSEAERRLEVGGQFSSLCDCLPYNMFPGLCDNDIRDIARIIVHRRLRERKRDREFSEQPRLEQLKSQKLDDEAEKTALKKGGEEKEKERK